MANTILRTVDAVDGETTGSAPTEAQPRTLAVLLTALVIAFAYRSVRLLRDANVLLLPDEMAWQISQHHAELPTTSVLGDDSAPGRNTA